MTTPARIVHQSSGRLRVEIPGKRGDRDFFATLAEHMASDEGVLAARGNAAAASLVVEHTSSAPALMRALAGAGLDLPSPSDATANEAKAGAGKIQSGVPGSSGRHVEPMLIASAVFGAVGVIQALRGKIMIPALSAFWYAASAFRLSQIGLPQPLDTGNTEAEAYREQHGVGGAPMAAADMHSTLP